MSKEQLSDSEKIEALRKILRPVIEWYEKVEADGEPDPSYLYDTTYEVFNDQLTQGDFQSIIEILSTTKHNTSKE